MRGKLGVTLDGGILIPNSMQRERQTLVEVIKGDHLSTPLDHLHRKAQLEVMMLNKWCPSHYHGNLPQTHLTGRNWRRKLLKLWTVDSRFWRKTRTYSGSLGICANWRFYTIEYHSRHGASMPELPENAASIQTYVYSSNPNRIPHSYIKT